MRIPIYLQREIARLHFHADLSERAIARTLGLSTRPVSTLRQCITAAGKSWIELHALDDDQWEVALGTHNRSIARRKEAPDWAWVHEQMRLPDATLEQVFQEWKVEHPNGIRYSQFTAGYRTWIGKQRIVLRQVHRPGDKMFADFAGRRIEIRLADRPEPLFAHLFVAVLGCSNYLYVEAVASQSTENWTRCIANAFEFFEGVTHWVVSDNLKAAVVRRERDRIVLNRDYVDCLSHYGAAALPTKPRSPRQNAKAEAGVQFAQRAILFPLRDRVFFSLEECNIEICKRRNLINERPFKRIDGCRRSRYEIYDRPSLKSLPTTRYEHADWRYDVRVGDDYLVEHGKCFYSVPSYLRTLRVDLRFAATILEIFHRSKRVATHGISEVPGTIVRLSEHMPVAHRRVLEGEPRQLMAWAEAAGSHIRRMLEHHLAERKDATNGLKAARKMRNLARLHGEERFDQVCAYALRLNLTALRSVESILRTKADQRPEPAGHRTQPPAHENVRGAHYFGED